jgi:hypothetical protein
LLPRTLLSSWLEDGLGCRIDQNSFALARADNVDSCPGQFAESCFASDKCVTAIPIHEHKACTATKTGACTLGCILVGASHVAGAAVGIGDYAAESRACPRGRSGWSNLTPFFRNSLSAMTCERDRSSGNDRRQRKRRK